MITIVSSGSVTDQKHMTGKLLLLYHYKGRHSFFFISKSIYIYIYEYKRWRASPGAAVKLCLGDLLVMGSNPETASLHMQG